MCLILTTNYDVENIILVFANKGNKAQNKAVQDYTTSKWQNWDFHAGSLAIEPALLAGTS